MSIRLTDCTIRDGGYLLNKNSDPEFVKGVMKGLSRAGIDFVETGFLQTKVNGESIVYRNSEDAARFLPEDRGRTQFLGFCDNSRYSLEDLDEYSGKSFKWLRISFGKHEIDESLKFCKGAQEKGYTVQFNPMDAVGYSESEWESLVSKVNEVGPGSMSIVDTFGAMYLGDLKRIYRMTDRLLDRGIAIGLHSHDNLGLSNALAETMAEMSQETGRDVILDGSLFGMGRGAGNASTELLASFLNKNFGADYDIPEIIDTIDRYIAPLRENVCWGYDLPMFVCGIEHAHVDNVYHLEKKDGCTPKDMYEVLEKLEPSQRTRYGKGYSKTDFSVLDRAYDEYVREGRK